MRAATYLRVSSREQVEGYSIPAQREACLRLIADEGWSLAEEFCDSGESARTTDRPQFQAMLQALADDATITVLVVHKLDRLARNLEDHVAVRAQLRKLGVQLTSVTESLEDSASGKLVEGIMASIAEFYSANLAQEVKKGMTEKARRGGWPTTAPVGYKNIRLQDSGGRHGEAVIVPDDNQANIVQQAFELYATGDWSLRDLHDEMSHRGLQGRRGGTLSRSKLAEMLHNRAYIGKVIWGGVEYDGTHTPLISEELFNQVQEVFRIHDRAGVRRRRNPHYLRGTLYCASCGSRLSSLTAKGRYTYFYCLGRQTKRTDCTEPYTPAADLETQIEDLHRDIELPEELRASIEAEIKVELDRREANRARSAGFLTQRLARLDTERNKLLKAYYADAITLNQLKAEQQRIDTETSRTQQQLTLTQDHLDAARQLITVALKLASNLHHAYTTAPAGKARQKRNQAALSAAYVGSRAIMGHEYEWPFGFMPKGHSGGSSKNRQVELRGFEPLTPSLRTSLRVVADQGKH